MSTHAQAVINAAADAADEILEGATSPAEAKPLLLEWISEYDPALAPTDRQQIAIAVLALLEREGFFTATPGGTAEDAEDGEPDE